MEINGARVWEILTWNQRHEARIQRRRRRSSPLDGRRWVPEPPRPYRHSRSRILRSNSPPFPFLLLYNCISRCKMDSRKLSMESRTRVLSELSCSEGLNSGPDPFEIWILIEDRLYDNFKFQITLKYWKLNLVILLNI